MRDKCGTFAPCGTKPDWIIQKDMKFKRILDRHARAGEKVKVYIEAYEHRNARAIFFTGVRIAAADWDARREEVRLKHPVAGALNRMIQEKETELLAALQQLIEHGEPLTLTNLKHQLGEGKAPAKLFVAWCMERLKGSEFRDGYLKHVHSVMRRIESFDPGLEVQGITLAWIERYHRHLLNSGLRPSSTRNHHKQIRKFYAAAAVAGLVPLPSPYDFFKVPGDRGRREALTSDELQRIAALVLSTRRLTHARDVFLFACYTGLSFADLHGLKPEHIVTDAGKMYVSKRRAKLPDNEPDTVIPLIAPAIEILKQYQTADRCLPVYTNQKYNEFLKEIAALAGIEKTLTSHVARHTFATVALDAGLPIEVVSKLLGHNSIKTTQIYAKVLKSRLFSEIDKFAERVK